MNMIPKVDGTAHPRRWRNLFQAQDFAWILFVGALLAGTPERNYNADILLPVIGAFQIIEPRLRVFASKRGQFFSLVLKLALSYLLVGYTHTLDSPYYSIFLVPVVSAATSYGLATVVLVTLIASLAYLSFLLPFYTPNWNALPESLYDILCLRVSFFAIIAFVVYDQARAKRQEMVRTKEAADRLAESNQSLQRAQASLRRSERLAALGQLTAGLAHELRNPLGTIKASAEMLNQKSVLDNPQIATEMASYIESEVDRMNSLITSFLNFARPLEIHPVMGDLHEVVAETVRRQAPAAFSKGVAITFAIAPEAAHFTFDPAVLPIALGNLIQNAIQASPAGGTVTIDAVKVDGQIEISIEDKGAGISPQNLENIFNPFFTTKPDGVGLGLAIVSKIVDEHQGKIIPASILGEGTSFRVILPADVAGSRDAPSVTGP
jgi:two-component system sensor histidine kinase HydH